MYYVLKRFLACMALLALPLLANADIVVIVNSSSALSSVKKSDLARVFLGKSNDLPGAGKVVPINLVATSKTREAFDKKMLNRSPAQMKSYWSRQLFSGEGTPPDEVKTDADMLQRISSDAKTIGYVDSAAVNDSVKVIQVSD